MHFDFFKNRKKKRHGFFCGSSKSRSTAQKIICDGTSCCLSDIWTEHRHDQSEGSCAIFAQHALFGKVQIDAFQFRSLRILVWKIPTQPPGDTQTCESAKQHMARQSSVWGVESVGMKAVAKKREGGKTISGKTISGK